MWAAEFVDGDASGGDKVTDTVVVTFFSFWSKTSETQRIPNANGYGDFLRHLTPPHYFGVRCQVCKVLEPL